MPGMVYSTEQGSLCPDCEQPKKNCVCNTSTRETSPQKTVVISRETKGRRGKGVTLISGISQNDMALKLLARELKAHCACGGTVKNGIIEIQGDRRDTVYGFLSQKGFTCKKSGG
jgi:translation initiation factor 1